MSQDSDSGQDQDPIRSPKVIVWVCLLLDLFLVCREPMCGDSVDRANIQTSFRGAALTVSATCNSGHTKQVRSFFVLVSLVSSFISVVFLPNGWRGKVG